MENERSKLRSQVAFTLVHCKAWGTMLFERVGKFPTLFFMSIFKSYSVRRVSTGSTLSARRTGTKQATRLTASNTPEMATKVN